jgi:glycosylphosphatidylinositol transamidase (GPIT) subunit GPI8
MHRQVRFMARSAASYGVAVLHNFPGKHLKQTCFSMDLMDRVDLMDLTDNKHFFRKIRLTGRAGLFLHVFLNAVDVLLCNFFARNTLIDLEFSKIVLFYYTDNNYK